MANTLRGAVALEPGGPSDLFGRLGPIPVYSRLGSLDTLDYSERTIWSNATGQQITPRRHVIAEAGSLGEIPNAGYDALLASHVLEHIANPLGALKEWSRVVRPGGHLLLVMPHRDGTFDHRRPVTTLDHFEADAERNTGEEDLTHLEEILALHDLERDPGAPNREVFEQRCRENHRSRAMHHHVFNSRTVVDLCRAASLQVLVLRPKLPFNIVCLCRVGDQPGGITDAELTEILSHSPFVSDQADAEFVA